MVKYSIVVPCYNEEDNINQLVEEFSKVHHCIGRKELEIILVDNGSVDCTHERIESCIKNRDFFKMVTVEKNQGYGYGLLEGMKVAQGQYIGWIHADLQFSPLLFVDIINDIEKKDTKGIVYYKGLRTNRPKMDLLFTLGMSCFETIYFRKKFWDINAQPTMMGRELWNKAINPPFGFSLDLYFYYLALVNNCEIHRFISPQKERTYGHSSWNTGFSARIKLVKRTLRDSREIKNNLKKALVK